MASQDTISKEEKMGVTSTVKSVASSPELNEEAAVVIPEKNLTRAIWTIVSGVALPVLPIVVVISVLFYIIFHHRIIIDPGWPALQITTEEVHRNATEEIHFIRHLGGDGAYYVLYNPSTITTVASWTSRVIPYLSSSIMALVAFFAARHIVLKSKHGDGSQLPNPEQLTILIDMLGGNGFSPLTEALHYRFFRNGRLISPLPAAFSALAVITVLGLTIPLIDTWFGVATKAATITQLYPRASDLSYGSKVSPEACPNGPRDNGSANAWMYDKSEFWPCNILIPLGHPSVFPRGLNEATRVSQDTSDVAKVHNYTDSSNTKYYYLGHPEQNALADYQAKTIATSSHCVPMTQLCYFNVNPGGYLFNCTSAFSGHLGSSVLNKTAIDEYSGLFPNVGIAFSENPQLTVAGEEVLNHDMSGFSNWTMPKIYTTNPLYYGAWAAGFPPPDFFPAYVGDTGIFYEDTPTGLGGVWFLNCSTTVYDVSYTWVNGAISTFNTTKSSTDLSALLSSPFALSSYMVYAHNALASIATAAGSRNNSRELSRIFGEGVSKHLLAFSMGAMEPEINEYEQLRNSTINVARIPTVPLYLLIGSKVLYVLAVLVLAVGAYCFTHPAETEVVKAQLSVKGLAAAHFDDPGLLRNNVIQEMQSRLDTANNQQQQQPSEKEQNADQIDPETEQPIKRSETAQATGATPPQETKVGLLPTPDGSWQFVTVAGGVWNSIKPIAENLVTVEAASGGLGVVGQVIKAWK